MKWCTLIERRCGSKSCFTEAKRSSRPWSKEERLWLDHVHKIIVELGCKKRAMRLEHYSLPLGYRKRLLPIFSQRQCFIPLFSEQKQWNSLQLTLLAQSGDHFPFDPRLSMKLLRSDWFIAELWDTFGAATHYISTNDIHPLLWFHSMVRGVLNALNHKRIHCAHL